MLESVWLDKQKYDEAERNWNERIYACFRGKKQIVPDSQSSQSSIVSEIARARQHIKNSLQSSEIANVVVPSNEQTDLTDRVQKLEKENDQLRTWCQDLQLVIQKLDSRIAALEGKKPAVSETKQPVKEKINDTFDGDDDDDELSLFSSDEEDEEDRLKRHDERLRAYAVKQLKKKGIVAKSSVVFDVKPWDDETDLDEMEKKVRSIQMDGLTWGASKRVPLAFGIYKLQIVCVVEDEKVSIDDLTETIQEFDDCVQSVDIAAFNKL